MMSMYVWKGRDELELGTYELKNCCMFAGRYKWWKNDGFQYVSKVRDILIWTWVFIEPSKRTPFWWPHYGRKVWNSGMRGAYLGLGKLSKNKPIRLIVGIKQYCLSLSSKFYSWFYSQFDSRFDRRFDRRCNRWFNRRFDGRFYRRFYIQFDSQFDSWYYSPFYSRFNSQLNTGSFLFTVQK